MFKRRRDECLEYGLRMMRSALELGVILHADIERMIGQFHGLYKVVLRVASADDEAESGEIGAVCVVELETVTVTFVYCRICEKAAFPELSRTRTRPGASCRRCSPCRADLP